MRLPFPHVMGERVGDRGSAAFTHTLAFRHSSQKLTLDKVEFLCYNARYRLGSVIGMVVITL